jgi:hypothetical protein
MAHSLLLNAGSSQCLPVGQEQGVSEHGYLRGSMWCLTREPELNYGDDGCMKIDILAAIELET